MKDTVESLINSLNWWVKVVNGNNMPDIEDQIKTADQDLQQKQQLLQRLLKSVKVYLVYDNSGGRHLHANKVFAKITDIPEHNWKVISLDDILPHFEMLIENREDEIDDFDQYRVSGRSLLKSTIVLMGTTYFIVRLMGKRTILQVWLLILLL
jgi:PAS domain-containing protein